MPRHSLVLSCLALLGLLVLFTTPAFSTSPIKSAHGTLSISTATNITYVTISNPPINLYDTSLSADLYDFLTGLDPANRTTPPPKVVVFRSADPQIFITHLDLSLLQFASTAEKTAFIAQFVAVTRLFQSLTTTVFIAEVDGVAAGAGNELMVQMDMRFAGPKAHAGAYEASVGSFESEGGLQFTARLINKGRAMQYFLSGDSVDCGTGKELGWFNDCLGSRTELEATVEALAGRIALRPAGALNAIKAALASLNPPLCVLEADLAAAAPLRASAEAHALRAKFLQLGKDQTRTPFELGLDGTLAELFE